MAEDEAAFEEPETIMEIPAELLPQVRQLLAQYKAAKKEPEGDK